MLPCRTRNPQRRERRRNSERCMTALAELERRSSCCSGWRAAICRSRQPIWQSWSPPSRSSNSPTAPHRSKESSLGAGESYGLRCAEALTGRRVMSRRLYLSPCATTDRKRSGVALPVTGECELINAEMSAAPESDATRGWLALACRRCNRSFEYLMPSRPDPARLPPKTKQRICWRPRP